MTQPGDVWGPSEYPQHDYRQNYPPRQPWQPPQYDSWEASQRPLLPPAAPPQFRPYALPPQFRPQPQQYVRPAPATRQPAARPRSAAVPRNLPPYPAHLVRFPSQMFPRARRRRGHSLGYYVYMGTHPVAVLIALYVNALIICCVLGWLMLVGSAWMMWAMLVTMAWLVQVAVAALRMALP